MSFPPLLSPRVCLASRMFLSVLLLAVAGFQTAEAYPQSADAPAATVPILVSDFELSSVAPPPKSPAQKNDLAALEDAALERLTTWLPKLSYPIRIGEHAQTAFALGIMLDYARAEGNESFAKLLTDRARKFYLADKNCPMAYEPSGEDFLSPCLAEADVMRRVLAPAEFGRWLKEFLPQIPATATTDCFRSCFRPTRPTQSSPISTD